MKNSVKAVPYSMGRLSNETVHMDIRLFSYIKETKTLIAELSDTHIKFYRNQDVVVHNYETGNSVKFRFHYCDFTPCGDIAGFNLNSGTEVKVLLIND